jgi:hypothetical protein
MTKRLSVAIGCFLCMAGFALGDATISFDDHNGAPDTGAYAPGQAFSFDLTITATDTGTDPLYKVGGFFLHLATPAISGGYFKITADVYFPPLARLPSTMERSPTTVSQSQRPARSGTDNFISHRDRRFALVPGRICAPTPHENLKCESLASAVTECNSNPNGVAATTWQRCVNYYFMQFNSWEYIYYQNRDGSIPKQLWVGADSYVKTFVQTKQAYVRFWSEMETAFDEPFRSYATQEFRRRPALPADKR